MPQTLRPALKPLPELDSICSSSPLPFAFCSQMTDSPHVHFPPTPTMTSTALTHSSNVYDRAPIRVMPNSCALPERGERVYSATDMQYIPPSTRESYFYPRSDSSHSLQSWADRGYPSCIPYDRYDISPVLTHDLSSESDESDPCGSPLLPSNIPHISVQLTKAHGFSSPDHFPNDYIPHRHDSDTPQLDQGASCSPPTKTKHHDRARKDSPTAKKNKVNRLQAGERVRRTSSCYGNNSIACDPPFDGCLGGF